MKNEEFLCRLYALDESGRPVRIFPKKEIRFNLLVIFAGRTTDI